MDDLLIVVHLVAVIAKFSGSANLSQDGHW
jgi:hypothetical protein